jgi:hypothetical protein
LDLEKWYGEGEEGRAVDGARVEGDVGEGIRLAILRGGKRVGLASYMCVAERGRSGDFWISKYQQRGFLASMLLLIASTNQLLVA